MRILCAVWLVLLMTATGCMKPPSKEAPPPVDDDQPVAGSPEARTIVEKAIAAHGGEAAIARLRTMRIKVEGSAELQPAGKKAPFVMEDIWQMPNRYKSSSATRFMDKDFTQTQAIDGDNGWLAVNGKVQDMPKADVMEMKEQKYGEDFDRLGFLNQPGITLSPVPAAKLDAGPVVVGVRIDSPGHRPVTLYFDAKTNLLVQRVHPVLNPLTGKEVMQEVTFSDHHEKDGVMHYRKIVAVRDGKVFFEGKVTEIEFLTKVDDKTFARPQ